MYKKINKDDKIPLAIDVNTSVAIRPYAKKFSSYLEIFARERISILIESWDHVTEHERNMIWQDILVCNCFYFVQSEVLLYFVQSKFLLYFVQSKVLLYFVQSKACL